MRVQSALPLCVYWMSKKIRKEGSNPLFSNIFQNWLHLMQAYIHETGKAKSNLKND